MIRPRIGSGLSDRTEIGESVNCKLSNGWNALGSGKGLGLLILLTAVAVSFSEDKGSLGAAEPGPECPAVPLELPGLQNVFALGPGLYSGGAPEGIDGFRSLEALGVKTIITVDGAAPDVAAARRQGMRYVHLPHGYDGISAGLQVLLAKAARELEGPLYVHCHHGKHRGPAAAAIICRANLNWSLGQAEAFLRRAGTSTNYSGLYAAVRGFRLPTIEQINSTPGAFPEVARVARLVDAMVEIDQCWERLKGVREAGYRVPEKHPDVQPAAETVVLGEHYREARRLPEVIQRGPDLLRRFQQAEAEAAEAERLLRLPREGATTDVQGQLDRIFEAIATSCNSCHEVHRDSPGGKSGY